MANEFIIKNGYISKGDSKIIGSLSATTLFGDGSNLNGISTVDNFTTGATLSENTIIFNRTDLSDAYNIDLTPILSGFTSDNFYVTGGTFSSNILVLGRNDGNSVIVTGFTSDDNYVTGGTYNSLTESINFKGTNSATTFNVDVSELLDDTNTFTTGATLNGNILQFNRNDLTNAYSVDLSSLSSSVNSGNVIYVDAVNGNNLTGVINNFTRPFSDLWSALNYTDTLTRTQNNRLLVYVRRGLYTNQGQMTFRDNVDVYCEPGVVFTGTFQLRTQSAVNSNFLGYARFEVSFLSAWGTAGHFDIRHESFINIEFDRGVFTGPCLLANFFGLNNLISIKANYIFSDGFNAGFGMTIRVDVNINVNILKYESTYSLYDFRFIGGVINISNNEGYLLNPNPYGYSGGFKQIFICYNSYTPKGKINIIGNYFNKVTTNPESTATGGFRFFGSPNVDVYFKGSIDAGDTYPAIVLSDGSGTLTIEGRVVGSRTCVSSFGSNRLFLNNTMLVRRTDAFTSPFSVGGSSEVYVNNSSYYSEFSGNLINMDTSTSKLYLNNVIAEGFVDLTGVTGTFINKGLNNPTIGINNVVTNRDYNQNIISDYLINLTINPNIKTPKFY
jgi:hypothetical protein